MDSAPPADVATDEWPNLTSSQVHIIIGVNIVSLFACWLLLRVIWRPPTVDEVQKKKLLETRLNEVRQQYMTIQVPEAKECLEGDSAGDYNEPWTNTFDLTFIYIMTGFLIMLMVWTQLQYPELWTNLDFWLEQLPKLLCMITVSFLGGLVCRYFCEVDERGYIITNKESPFKVNYTRKLQHFAAYMIPLVLHTRAAANIRGPLTQSWGNWFTLLGFFILIQPLRERFKCIMLQFNALDRPEDRPNTISWIVGGNVIPGFVMIVIFRYLYSFTGQGDMVYIFIFITGVGDGFAEPVGIYLGRHKYWTSSLFGERKYQRSWEGSACIFWSGILFVSVYYYTFASAWQFWMAMIFVPVSMAYAEAVSPHTIDTPFLMGVGGLQLLMIQHMSVFWN